MKLTPFWLDTHSQEPDRSITDVGAYVDVAVGGAGDVADIYLARDALESAAIRQIIARGLTETAYEALDKHITEMERAAAAGDWAAVDTSDVEFHSALVAAARSQRLQRMFTTVISAEMRVCLGMVSTGRSCEDAVAGHREIVRAVREGDADQALSMAARRSDH